MEFHKTEKPLRGEITIPGDKSISHRSVMFGAISQGTTEITNFLQGQRSEEHTSELQSH